MAQLFCVALCTPVCAIKSSVVMSRSQVAKLPGIYDHYPEVWFSLLSPNKFRTVMKKHFQAECLLVYSVCERKGVKMEKWCLDPSIPHGTCDLSCLLHSSSWIGLEAWMGGGLHRVARRTSGLLHYSKAGSTAYMFKGMRCNPSWFKLSPVFCCGPIPWRQKDLLTITWNLFCYISCNYF